MMPSTARNTYPQGSPSKAVAAFSKPIGRKRMTMLTTCCAVLPCLLVIFVFMGSVLSL